jgi:hypothetical protein
MVKLGPNVVSLRHSRQRLNALPRRYLMARLAHIACSLGNNDMLTCIPLNDRDNFNLTDVIDVQTLLCIFADRIETPP